MAQLTATPPLAAALEPVSPNPVLWRGRVRFSLPAPAPVTLNVYDLQDRRVATLLDHEPQFAGQHEVTIRTDGWTPGCYLYRLEAGGLTETLTSFGSPPLTDRRTQN